MQPLDTKLVESNALRLFFAVEVSHRIQNELAKVQTELSKKIPYQIKWVQPDQIHATLRFLGETKPDVVSSLMSSVKISLGSFAPFEIEVKDIGAFPDWRKPRVIWAGIERGKKELLELNRIIEEIVVKLGWLPEQKFSPHLTIGRVKNFSGHSFDLSSLKKKLTYGQCQVDRIVLFQSILRPSGSIYTKFATHSFV